MSEVAARLRWLVLVILPAVVVLLGLSQPETGRLRVESQEGVEVFWEGVSLGATDERGRLEISGIPPGRYSIVLRKTGFIEQQLSIEVAAGETTLTLRLERPPAPELRPDPAVLAEQGGGESSAIEEPRPDPLRQEAAAPTPTAPAAEPAGPTSAAEALSDGTAADEVVASETAAAPEEEGSGAGLGLATFLLALVAVWMTVVFRRRRSQSALEEAARRDPDLQVDRRPSPDRRVGAAKPTFLQDLERREVALEGFLGADGGPVERRVVDIGAVESEPVEEDS